MEAKFVQIDIREAKRMIDSDNVTIADIRAPEAFHESHIARAVNVGQENIGQFIANANKDIPLICCCYHGMSSQNAAQYFSAQGFKTVYSIDGGFEAWRCEYPTTQGS